MHNFRGGFTYSFFYNLQLDGQYSLESCTSTLHRFKTVQRTNQRKSDNRSVQHCFHFLDRLSSQDVVNVLLWPVYSSRVSGSRVSYVTSHPCFNTKTRASANSRVWNVFPISDPPSQAPHLRPPISGPPSQAPHLRPSISGPPPQNPHLRPLISDPLAQTPELRHHASHLRPYISDPPSQVLFPLPVISKRSVKPTITKNN